MADLEIKLNEEDYRLYAGFIETKAGLQFFDAAGRASLDAVISERMKEANLSDPLEYFDLLRSQAGRDEFRTVLEMLTNNETSFFRNLPQFEALTNHILPEIIKARESTRRLRVWCAGCASGEEPFSLVMALLEVLPVPAQWKIEVVGTDINPKVLWKARRGVFSGRTFRSMPQSYAKKYIIERGNGEREVSHLVRQHVEFHLANLMEELSAFDGRCDLIFCRNVMIYFRDQTIKKVLAKFHRCLASDGYLLVGHAENPNNYTDLFSPLQVREAFVYVPTSKKSYDSPVEVPTEDEPATADTKEGTAQLPASRPRVFLTEEKEHALEQFIATARHAFHRERFQEAEELLNTLFENDRAPAAAHVLMACLMVTTNREAQAAEHVRIALEEDQFCAGAHYLQGLFELDSGKNDAAMQSFKRAIYSDNEFALSYFQLARLFQDQMNYRMAVKNYQNALRALELHTDEKWKDLYTGLSPHLVRQACHSAIEICQASGNLQPMTY